MKPGLVKIVCAFLVVLNFKTSAATLYVSLASTNPVPPYADWSTAATNIQDAVDASTNGDLILVTNGVYQTAGRTAPDGVLTSVVVTNVVTLQSVNGLASTLIDGNQSMRCVYLTDGAALTGFTLTNGYVLNGFGGGIFCTSTNALVSNCLLTSGYSFSSPPESSASAYQGTLYNCKLVNNHCRGAAYAVLKNCMIVSNSGGGTYSCSLNICTLIGNSGGPGGGAYGGTLTNCTLAWNTAGYGGGAYGQSGAPIVLNNCLICSNTAIGNGNGGGAASSPLGPWYTNCILNNCTVAYNTAGYGGGACRAVLNNCIVSNNTSSVSGGGVYGGGLLNNCVVISNTAEAGGGADGFDIRIVLNNCLLVANVATIGGGYDCGGARGCTLNNCTIINNSGPSIGGEYDCSLTNCIVFYNTPSNGSNTAGTLNHCCIIPIPAVSIGYNAIGNITNEPLFVNLAGGDFHLQSNSPCINSGNNAHVTSATDFDGNPRIVGGTVDIGAYEYQTPASVISYAWLQQYGLPTDGSVDYADLDGTPFNVYQDWIAGLNPTNALSVLAMLSPVPTNSPAGLVVSWESVSNRTYFLQSSTNLAAVPPFSTIQSNIAGQIGTTSFMDTSATNGGPYFYRVGVQQ